MIQNFSRLLIGASAIGIVVCVVLLLNFTAPNPTGRRYSSEMPLTTGQGNAQAIGDSAERVLAEDLGVPNNNQRDQRQCLCNTRFQTGAALPNECRVCTAYSETISNFRVPDFLSTKFIAESKNRQNLLYSYSDQVDQINDYVTGALALNRPLWVFIRVNTNLSLEFVQAVETTGGGVVRYFTVSGYVDPVDNAARTGLATCGVLMVVGVMLPRLGRKSAPRPVRPPSPLQRTERKLNETQDFKNRAIDRTRLKIDEQDSRDE